MYRTSSKDEVTYAHHELHIAKGQEMVEENKGTSYQGKLQKKIQCVAEGNVELCIEFLEMDEPYINIIKAMAVIDQWSLDTLLQTHKVCS